MMRVRLLQNVANDRRGDVITTTAEQGEKLIRTGYATEATEKSAKKTEAA